MEVREEERGLEGREKEGRVGGVGGVVNRLPGRLHPDRPRPLRDLHGVARRGFERMGRGEEEREGGS